jgi:hypothetical protein
VFVIIRGQHFIVLLNVFSNCLIWLSTLLNLFCNAFLFLIFVEALLLSLGTAAFSASFFRLHACFPFALFQEIVNIAQIFFIFGL